MPSSRKQRRVQLFLFYPQFISIYKANTATPAATTSPPTDAPKCTAAPVWVALAFAAVALVPAWEVAVLTDVRVVLVAVLREEGTVILPVGWA